MMTNLHENVEHVKEHIVNTDLHEHVEEHGDPAAGRHCYVQQHVLPKICFENVVMHVLHFDPVDRKILIYRRIE